MKKTIYILFAFLMISALLKNSAIAIEIGGFTFDDNAFADKAYHVIGDIAYIGITPTGDDDADLTTALAGANLSTYISGQDPSCKYTVILEFIDNYLFNGSGPDLIGFEFGTAEPFSISVYNPLADEWTPFRNVSTTDVGSINVAQIDFDYWGLAPDLRITKIMASTTYWQDSWIGADLAAFGGLNSNTAPVPEPATMFLLASGLVGLAGLKSRFTRRKPLGDGRLT